MTAIQVRADDGAALSLTRGRGDAATRGNGIPILLVHGTFSNRRFFGGSNGLAQYLADQGYDAWVAELRGRGGDPLSKEWEYEDWIVRDAPALLRTLRQETGQARVIWLGHSAGGVIGIGCAARFPDLAQLLAGLILIAAPAPHAAGALHAAVAGLGNGIGRVLGRFPARALRLGPANEPPGILGQWSDWTIGAHWTGRDGFDYRAGAARVTAPALAIAGGGDLLTPPSSCRRLLDSLGSTDREMVVCGRREGFSKSFTHNRLVLSPPARREVWPLIPRWLEERFH